MSLPTLAIHTVNVRLAFIYATHPEIPAPYTAPPVPTYPFVEVPHILFWGPGASVTSPKTLTDNFTPAQLGHDCGIGVIHVGLPPGPLSPVNTATSSCKVVFASGSVLSEGKPTAGHLPPIINLLQCFAPVPLPIGGFLLIPNTVIVGMSPMDILMGIVRVAIAIVIALIFKKLGSSAGKLGKAWQWIGEKAAFLGGSGFWTALGNNLLSSAAEDLAKIPLGIVMEGKIALPYNIAELDLTNGQFKVFYWNVGGPSYQVNNYSAGGLTQSAQTPDAANAPAPAGGGSGGSGGGSASGAPPSSGSPSQQATTGIPVLGGA